jgi:pantothenate kinase type III
LTKNKTAPVIAVDIGCTRTHIGLIDTTDHTCLFRHDFLSADTHRSIVDVIDEITDLTKEYQNLSVIIAGGNDTYAASVENAFLSGGMTPISHVKYHKGLPVTFNYEKPSNLGADRIAHALYAVEKYKDRNIIIISSGTAITVDLINKKGEFLGGAILAGVEAQLKILHSSTGTLPLITMPTDKIIFPGNSTETCMQAGTAHGIAGAMNLFVHTYQMTIEDTCTVLATGGAWHLTSSLVNFDFISIPDLTLIGTALFK